MWMQRLFRFMVKIYNIAETGFTVFVVLAVISPHFLTW